MNKLISIVLLCVLLFGCVSGCAFPNPPDNSNNTPEEEDTGLKPDIPNNTPEEETVGLELENTSDLAITLIAYLKQYHVCYDLITKTFGQQVDDIRNGTQALHVVFNPDDFYFVCGYYNVTEEHREDLYCCAEKYTWVEYKNEAEIKEYHKGTKFFVAFQINKALTINDIFSTEQAIPNMEHFKIYYPTFENGRNVCPPVVFDDSFIYLNFPNCYLNLFTQDKSTMYYSTSIYYDMINTKHCINLEGVDYLPFHLYTLNENGEIVDQYDYIRSFGEYYDVLMGVMENDKYRVAGEYGRTLVYGTISIEAFATAIKSFLILEQ